MRLGIITLNLANPSAARAERLLAWLAERPEQIIVLTETGTGPGTNALLRRLAGAGWEILSAKPADGERGVAIATRLGATTDRGELFDYLPWRSRRVAVGGLEVVGLYVPSRDESREKVERKRRFCSSISTWLKTHPPRQTVVIGDLNVLEPVHRPHYETFRDWEYRLYDEFLVSGYVDAYRHMHADGREHSWVDYEGHGYRFDHVHASADLADRIAACEYVHDTRDAELSDHSALVLRLEWPTELGVRETAKPGDGDSLVLF